MTSRWTLRIEVALLLASLSSVPVNGLFHANTIVFLLPAYSEECFFIPTKHVQEVIDIDYNVIKSDALTGDMQVEVMMSDQEGHLVSTPETGDSGTHTVNQLRIGDYKICFGNYVSPGKKQVQLDYTVSKTNKDDQDDDDDDDDSIFRRHPTDDDDSEDPEFSDIAKAEADYLKQEFHRSVEDIKDTLQRMLNQLARTVATRMMHKASMTKDMNIVSGNLERINFWSAVHCVALVAASVAQVVLVRSLFEDKSRQNRTHMKIST